ncbi:alpha/beta hydrolase [Mycobacterium sp.]|uniref:putative alpha/beta hydrolase n=1 Tax=Mycobacterium sp. TaxID=1785 RepID=UPI003BADA98E
MRLRYISVSHLIGEAGGDPWAIDSSVQVGRPARISELAQAFHDAGRCTSESGAAFAQARRRFEVAWNREDGEHRLNDSVEVQRATASLGVRAAQLPKIAVDLENIAADLAEAQRKSAESISSLEAQLQQIDTELGEALEIEKTIRLTSTDQAALDALIDALEQQATVDTKTVLGHTQSIRNDYSDKLQKTLSTLRTDEYAPAGTQVLDEPGVPAKPEDAIQIPPSETTAEDVEKWWDSLSRKQRQQLVAEHPPELGNLNGIAAVTRDLVNQAVMDDDINRVESTADLRGVPTAEVLDNPVAYGLPATDAARYRNAVRTRDGLEYDRWRGTGNERPVMLWAYDPVAFNGQGKAAIAIGNPDFARNTAVIVPGTGSSVEQGWMAEHGDAINLYDQSLAAEPAHHYTAVIAWMGYDAPDGLADVRVSRPELARDGGELLAADVNGLWVTHDRLTPQHVTVIGHSYGSTTVADAFANSGMRANDAVLIGSPGTDLARNAAGFHLDGGNVYVGAASTDPISWIGQADGVPGELLKGTLRNYGIPLPLDSGLGRDPAGEGFGSTRFEAEVPGSGSLDRDDHSHYYTMGSESLRSITNIAIGQPDRLLAESRLAEGRRQPHIGAFRIPGVPGYIDPEGDRSRETIQDDHQYPSYAPSS